MKLDSINHMVALAPRYGWSRNAEAERENAIRALYDYLESLDIGTVLKVGVVTRESGDPWTLTKIEDNKWKGFHYQDYGINALAMADSIFQHLKAVGNPSVYKIRKEN